MTHIFQVATTFSNFVVIFDMFRRGHTPSIQRCCLPTLKDTSIKCTFCHNRFSAIFCAHLIIRRCSMLSSRITSKPSTVLQFGHCPRSVDINPTRWRYPPSIKRSRQCRWKGQVNPAIATRLKQETTLLVVAEHIRTRAYIPVSTCAGSPG